MATQTSNSSLDTEKDIKLVDGKFTKAEALAIVSSLIDQKINFHKIELQSWENNHLTNKEAIRERIKELQEERDHFKMYLKGFEGNAKHFKITGHLNIEVID
jgi:transposase-like protein